MLIHVHVYTCIWVNIWRHCVSPRLYVYVCAFIGTWVGLLERIVTTTQITLGISSTLEGALTSFLPLSPAALQQDVTAVVTESTCSWASVETCSCSLLHLALDDALVRVVRVCFSRQGSVLSYLTAALSWTLCSFFSLLENGNARFPCGLWTTKLWACALVWA